MTGLLVTVLVHIHCAELLLTLYEIATSFFGAPFIGLDSHVAPALVSIAPIVIFGASFIDLS